MAVYHTNLTRPACLVHFQPPTLAREMHELAKSKAKFGICHLCRQRQLLMPQTILIAFTGLPYPQDSAEEVFPGSACAPLIVDMFQAMDDHLLCAICETLLESQFDSYVCHFASNNSVNPRPGTTLFRISNVDRPRLRMAFVAILWRMYLSSAEYTKAIKLPALLAVDIWRCLAHQRKLEENRLSVQLYRLPGKAYSHALNRDRLERAIVPPTTRHEPTATFYEFLFERFLVSIRFPGLSTSKRSRAGVLSGSSTSLSIPYLDPCKME